MGRLPPGLALPRFDPPRDMFVNAATQATKCERFAEVACLLIVATDSENSRMPLQHRCHMTHNNADAACTLFQVLGAMPRLDVRHMVPHLQESLLARTHRRTGKPPTFVHVVTGVAHV